MSKYTTEVRTICENLIGLKSPVGYGSVNDILSQAAPLVFNFDWPIFDEAYRRVLEIKILKHFYTREIGLETVGLWKLKLDTKMNEIMPYYNQLYKTELLEFNPLYDVDLTRDRVEEREGSNKTDGGFNNENVFGKKNNYSEDNTVNSDTTDDTTTSGASDTTGSSKATEDNTRTVNSKTAEGGTNTGKNTDRYSDTPQGAISDLESNNYLTNARIIDNSSTNISESSANTNETNTGENSIDTEENLNYNNSIERNVNRKDNTNKTGENEESGSSSDNGTNYSYQNITDTNKYLEHVKGKQGSKSYSEMIVEYRKTFLNIDMMVIEELEPLFMQLW